MILDPASMTISHEEVTWAPPRRLWLLAKGMSKWIGRTWEHQELLDMMGSSACDPKHVGTQIKLIRKAFRDPARRWPDPILTRVRLGYAWTLPVTLAPAVHAPAAGADEFRFKPHERMP